MKLSRTQTIIVAIVGVIILAGILIFLGIIPGLRQEVANQNDKLTGDLVVWGVFDSETAVSKTLIADFKARHPNVNISYRSLDARTYEDDLINALAAGSGPDVFMVKNTWLPKHYNKLDPRDPKEFTVVNFADLYPQVATKDFVREGKVYAMPLYIDTLATIYNKALFDAAGIAQPPRSWEEFAQIIPELRKLDESGRITQAAAAIGGSNKNINEANDLLFQMMLQYGVEMTNDGLSSATFANGGQGPLDFYLSFANSRSTNYTWDRGFHYSIDGFAEESVAMIFNYGYQLEQLKEKNPFLQIGVAPMLQPKNIDRPITYASYFGLGVSATSQNKTVGWTFVDESTAGDGATNAKYLNEAHRSPALRSLIAASTNDSQVGVFAKQALMATSWPQVDSTAINVAFAGMLESIVTGQLTSQRGLQQAEDQVTQIMQRSEN